ncbi:hypothetical protein EON83_30180 [bacterium]|nr:MAG: hypothetical protein EON83_30180 [bacterium]
MNDDHITLLELLKLTALLGAPVFIVAALAFNLMIRRLTKRPWRQVVLLSLAGIAASLVASTAVWLSLGEVFSNLPENIFMIGGFIYLPGLISTILILLCFWLFLRARAVTARRQHELQQQVQ